MAGKPTKNKSDAYEIGAVVLNLTGVQKKRKPTHWKKAGFRSQFNYPIINLETISAKGILKKVVAQELPINLLGFIPLMKGGCESGIIKTWLAEATKIEDTTIPADLGAIVKTFADLVKQKEVWEKALEGWNMVESQFLKEQTAKTRLETTRELLLDDLKIKLGDSPLHEQKLAEIQDQKKLDRFWKKRFTATSWDEIIDLG